MPSYDGWLIVASDSTSKFIWRERFQKLLLSKVNGLSFFKLTLSTVNVVSFSERPRNKILLLGCVEEMSDEKTGKKT